MKKIKNKSDTLEISFCTEKKDSEKKCVPLTHNIIAKIGAFLLVIIMSIITVVCAVGAIIMSMQDMYNTPQSVFFDEVCEDMAKSDCEKIIAYLAINQTDSAERYCSQRDITSFYITDSDNTTVLWEWRNWKDMYYSVGNFGYTYEWDCEEDFGFKDGKVSIEVTIGSSNNVDEVSIDISDNIDNVFWNKYGLAYSLINFAYSMLYWVYVIGTISFIITVVCFIFLMSASGHRKGYDEVKAGWGTKIPFDLLTGALILLGGSILWLMYILLCESPYLITNIILILLVLFIVLETAVIGWFMSLAVRVKLGKWWNNTIIFRLLVVLWRIVKFFVKKLKALFKLTFKLLSHIPLVWKTVLIILVVSFAELFFMVVSWNHYDNLIALWFFSTVILGIAVLYCAIVLKKLQKSGEALANGDLSYQIDTSKIFGDFKKHGDSLNSIAKGMTLAVEQRMKSERMKTELITNVSHDIKTPLTSIINYTDLISKEPCNNEKIIEYSSVLLRQSERLKRLIDDLVEASKASTGNLEVILAPCEANILLTQVVGEYDEKLKSKNLELITTHPSNEIMIMADGRRLLRVFDNLINNICKYAQRSTRVYLSLEKQGEEAVITFKNTSHSPLNMSADELMERFVRGDASRNTEGNGLGLSIAKSLTELQKGSLELFIDGDLFKVTLKFPTIK